MERTKMTEKILTPKKAIELLNRTVVIPEGYTHIGASAFDYTQIVHVICPTSLRIIRDSAFGFCYDLEDINIPETVTKIGHHAFFHCEKLQTLTLSDNVKMIGIFAFKGCDQLTIRCSRNSYAHRYCVKEGIKTEII